MFEISHNISKLLNSEQKRYLNQKCVNTKLYDYVKNDFDYIFIKYVFIELNNVIDKKILKCIISTIKKYGEENINYDIYYYNSDDLILMRFFKDDGFLHNINAKGSTYESLLYCDEII